MKISVGLGTNAHQIAPGHDPGLQQALHLFRGPAREAKEPFRAGRLAGRACGRAERIRFYDDRVDECVERLRHEFDAASIDDADLAAGQAALYRPAAQPQAAGTGRDLLQFGDHQDPAPQLLSTTISSSSGHPSRPRTSKRRHPVYRSYLRQGSGLRGAIRKIVSDFDWHRPLPTSIATWIPSPWRSPLPERHAAAQVNFQIQVLASAFYRNKAAYIIGKAINGRPNTLRHPGAARR